MKKLKLTLTIIAALGLISSANATLTSVTLPENCSEFSVTLTAPVKEGVLVLLESGASQDVKNWSDIVVFNNFLFVGTATLYSDPLSVCVGDWYQKHKNNIVYIQETAYPDGENEPHLPGEYTYYKPTSDQPGYSSCKEMEYQIDSICAAVPEPSTYVAGALLLLPFGVSTIRSLRKNKAA